MAEINSVIKEIKTDIDVFMSKKNKKKPSKADSLIAKSWESYKKNQLLEAGQFATKAIEKNSKDSRAYYLAGMVMWVTGDFERAVLMYQKCLEYDRENTLFYYSSFGKTLMQIGKHRDAVAVLLAGVNMVRDKWSEKKKEHKKHQLSLHYQICGVICFKINDYDASIRFYEMALNVDPDNNDIIMKLSSSYFQKGEYKKSHEMVKQLSDSNDNIKYKIKHALMHPMIIESEDEIIEVRKSCSDGIDQLLELAKKYQVSNPYIYLVFNYFYLSYHGYNNRKLLTKLSRAVEAICPRLLYTAPHCKNYQGKSTGDKIKIGFISRFFYEHSVGRCFNNIIEKLADIDDFNVYMLVDDAISDQRAQKLASKTTRHVLPPEYHNAINFISDLELDVIIYLDIGMIHNTYLLAHARLAPLQCIMPGHPDTTGIRNMDYYILQAVSEKAPEIAQKYYSERIWLSDNIQVYPDKPEIPTEGSWKSRKELNLPADCTLYICPMTMQKIHPEFDQILAEILRRDDNAKIMIFETSEGHRKVLERRLQNHLEDFYERLIISKMYSYDDFKHVVYNADVLLDTHPFGSGSTGFVQFAVGTPMITRTSEFFCGRLLTGYYNVMGVTDCITDNFEDYITKAIEIANNPELRADIRQRILANNHKIYNDSGFTDEMAIWLRNMIHNYQPISKPHPEDWADIKLLDEGIITGDPDHDKALVAQNLNLSLERA